MLALALGPARALCACARFIFGFCERAKGLRAAAGALEAQQRCPDSLSFEFRDGLKTWDP